MIRRYFPKYVNLYKAEIDIKESEIESLKIIVVNEDLSGPNRNEVISSTRVWSSGNDLHIEAAGSGQVQIYALTGALVKTLAVSAGENVERITLPKGIYIVRLEGKSYKIRI
jgi:hypothetical protein